MRRFIFILFIFSILFGCSAKNQKIEQVLTQPIFPKYTGKFPAILDVFPDGEKTAVNIGNPYKTTIIIAIVNKHFQVIDVESYKLEIPGIHKIDVWKPSGDYMLYSFDNKESKALCCYDRDFDEVKLYKPDKIKIIDNIIFLGKFIKHNSDNKFYVACIVNKNNMCSRVKKAGKELFKNE